MNRSVLAKSTKFASVNTPLPFSVKATQTPVATGQTRNTCRKVRISKAMLIWPHVAPRTRDTNVPRRLLWRLIAVMRMRRLLGELQCFVRLGASLRIVVLCKGRPLLLELGLPRTFLLFLAAGECAGDFRRRRLFLGDRHCFHQTPRLLQ